MVRSRGTRRCLLSSPSGTGSSPVLLSRQAAGLSSHPVHVGIRRRTGSHEKRTRFVLFPHGTSPLRQCFRYLPVFPCHARLVPPLPPRPNSRNTPPMVRPSEESPDLTTEEGSPRVNGGISERRPPLVDPPQSCSGLLGRRPTTDRHRPRIGTFPRFSLPFLCSGCSKESGIPSHDPITRPSV